MRILHLEDSPEDAELVRAHLLGEWPECEITSVATRERYLAELPGSYDLILSDFSLVGFDGNEALRLARATAPGRPFIFLSGNIGEDRAIDAVRAGADDYVLKDRPLRLTTAIRRAFRESQERKRLRQTEIERERLAATLESSPDFIGHAGPDHRILYLNRAARRLLQLPDDFDIGTLRIEDCHPPEVCHHLQHDYIPAAIATGFWSGESILTDRAGHHIPVAQTIIPHRADDGSIAYFSTLLRDLTARKQNEALINGQNQVLEMIAGGEPLQETLHTLLRVIEQQADEMLCSILVVTDNGKQLRHAAAPRLPRSYTDAVDGVEIGPEAGSCGTAVFRRAPVIVTDVATDPLWRHYRDLALAHGLHANWATPIFDIQHHLVGTFAVYLRQPGAPSPRQRHLIDVAVHIAAICFSHHAAERRLRDQADILQKAGDSIIVTDLEDRVTFWNASAARTLGWPVNDALGRPLRQLLGESAVVEIDSARAAAKPHEDWRGELHLRHRDAVPVVVDGRITVLRDATGEPQGRLIIATDITEKKRIEEQFFRAQRLESLGMLAAGIAHDLNNVLAPMLLAAPMLRDHATDPNDLRMIATLEKSAERGAALVRQILGFAHGADGGHRVVQVKHLLRDVATFIEETFPKSITLDDHIPPDLWPVKANPTQLHQVLLNLAVNARDAMPDGGTLTLRGENVVLSPDTASEIPGGRPGAYLALHVTDTGTGIPPDVLAHIWEPFFTTKGAGKGTGLGLSTVRGIVETHGGFISLKTVLRKGTAFHIYFPADGAPQTLAAATAAPALAPRGDGELILVVDDEPSIRNMSAAMLARHGYRALTAADGAEGVALFAPRAKQIRLVVTDLSMPHLDGAAFAGVVRRLNPDVKIIAVSGLGQESQTRQATPHFADAFLIKPFRPESLLTTVYDLLRAPPNPPPPLSS